MPHGCRLMSHVMMPGDPGVGVGSRKVLPRVTTEMRVAFGGADRAAANSRRGLSREQLFLLVILLLPHTGITQVSSLR